MKSPGVLIEDVLTSKFIIKTLNAGVMDEGKVSIFGADTVQYNLTGTVTERETAGVLVEARLTLDKILKLYQNGFYFSLVGKDKLPIFIRALETLIENLYKLKSPNVSEESLTIPGINVSLKEITTLYVEMINNNKDLVDRMLVKELKDIDTGILVIGNELSSTSKIHTGEDFVRDVMKHDHRTTHVYKNKIERIRNEY